MTRKTLGKLIILGAICVFILVGLSALAGRILSQRGPHEDALTIVIPAGAHARQIATLLENQGAIRNADLFYWTAKLTGLAPTLKAGEYLFPAQISTRDILNRIALGKTQNRSITFIEGWTTYDILKLLEDTPTFTGETKALEEPIVEGLLYPDTYNYTFGEKRSKIIRKMQLRAEDELNKAWENRDSNLPLNTPEELLALASIVEKETSSKEEMPRIAGVYINRLQKGMLLQSDPTVIYGLIKTESWNGNLQKRHLKDDSNPYNTYKHKGLPPTAIANPSSAALQAAAHPEKNDYLFFVATGYGGHNFSKTYQEHKQNVAKYLIEYRAQQRKAVQ